MMVMSSLNEQQVTATNLRARLDAIIATTRPIVKTLTDSSHQLSEAVTNMCSPLATDPLWLFATDANSAFYLDGNIGASFLMETGADANLVQFLFRSHSPGQLIWFGDSTQGGLIWDELSIYLGKAGALVVYISIASHWAEISSPVSVFLDNEFHVVSITRTMMAISMQIDNSVPLMSTLSAGFQPRSGQSSSMQLTGLPNRHSLNASGEVFIGHCPPGRCLFNSVFTGCLAHVIVDGVPLVQNSSYFISREPLAPCTELACAPRIIEKLLSSGSAAVVSVNNFENQLESLEATVTTHIREGNILGTDIRNRIQRISNEANKSDTLLKLLRDTVHSVWMSFNDTLDANTDMGLLIAWSTNMEDHISETTASISEAKFLLESWNDILTAWSTLVKQIDDSGFTTVSFMHGIVSNAIAQTDFVIANQLKQGQGLSEQLNILSNESSLNITLKPIFDYVTADHHVVSDITTFTSFSTQIHSIVQELSLLIIRVQNLPNGTNAFPRLHNFSSQISILKLMSDSQTQDIAVLHSMIEYPNMLMKDISTLATLTTSGLANVTDVRLAFQQGRVQRANIIAVGDALCAVVEVDLQQSRTKLAGMSGYVETVTRVLSDPQVNTSLEALDRVTIPWIVQLRGGNETLNSCKEELIYSQSNIQSAIALKNRVNAMKESMRLNKELIDTLLQDIATSRQVLMVQHDRLNSCL